MREQQAKKIKCVAYARFSPRPLQASCQCGHTWNVKATGDEEIFTACLECKNKITLSNCESCESQLSDIRQYASKRGHEIVSQHTDKALSGSDDCQDRPGLFDAKVACKRGYLLIVRNLDRLFRDMDKSALFRAEMNSKGVRICSLEQPEANTQTATGKLMACIYDWVSEIKREEIRARTRVKMLEYQRDGRKMSAQPPYGFDVDPENTKRLIQNPTEQSHIVTVKALHQQGLGLRATARWLEQNKIPRRGKPDWNHQLVKSILIREGLWSST